ncbi:sialic acid-binding Ig-like lectin 15 [Suncus etruscus]|uniref:sialic acid-binding Ig-like lectin 15 n=1 Tax=Suncus etruscus TaxID=109475 RepID=UPI00210FEDC6|nr:sialic acid-binding Ig-like lectin 15 [Suncus etruscus]
MVYAKRQPDGMCLSSQNGTTVPKKHGVEGKGETGFMPSKQVQCPDQESTIPCDIEGSSVCLGSTAIPSMKESCIYLLACLVCILQMGYLVRTEGDTTGSLINTEAHSAPSQRWSMQLPAEVRAVAGEAAVLPCTFTHPHGRYDGPLTAIWRTGEPFAGPQVFRCAVARGAELCRTALSLHGRFHLLGRPRRNDLSLRVERLGPDDDGRYFCRVELAGDVHDRFESRQGLWLRVTAAAPRIVNVSVLPGPEHAFRALCTAEGEPPPALVWSGPKLGNSSSSSGSGPTAAPQAPRAGHSRQVTAELPALGRDGRYTCTASNSLGRVEASVYLFRFHGPPGPPLASLLLGGALGLKALLLLGLLAARAARGRPEHQAPQDSLPRPQAQESSYENLSHMSSQRPQAAVCSP